MNRIIAAAIAIGLLAPGQAAGQETGGGIGLIPRFEIAAGDIDLSRLAQPNTYFDKAGRRFAVLGFESGTFEAWAWPLKLFRQFSFSFLIGSSTVPIEGREIVRFVETRPAATTLTFTDQSFTVRATFVAAIEEAGALVLLEVDAIEPLTIVCGFIPVLQPMWPAGIGGQYAYWDGELAAYLISEPTRRNHGYVGSPAARGISYTPAHMLSDAPNQFKIEIADPAAAAGKFIPVVMAGGPGARDDVKALYRKLAADPEAVLRGAEAHYRKLRESSLRVKTPEPSIDLALEWAKVALDTLVVDNPNLGRGLVAGLGVSGTGGRPGFGWFFGGDAYLNSLALNGFGAHATTREALAFTRKWQREDGKMAHELSQADGYVDWWKDYPYGYIHGDTTPYYIAAVDDYYRATGDAEFVKESWPSLKKAYEWCLGTDEDGDGLMDNRKAGLGALEFGALTGIQTDIYLASVWLRANEAMPRLAEAAGAAEEWRAMAGSGAAEERLAALRETFDRKFWDPERGQYAYAFNKAGDLVAELTPWSAMPVAWELGRPERRAATMENMAGADMATDWGVRMLSRTSSLFEPLNYNYGAAWPFLTGWAAAGHFAANLHLQGFQALMSVVRHTFDNAQGTITELYSGAQNVWPREAVGHQGFSSTGVALPLVRGLFGLEADVPEKTVTFAPRFPADWEAVEAKNFKAGGRRFDFLYGRQGGRVSLEVLSEKVPGWTLVFAPVFGPGATGFRASINGRPVETSPAPGSGNHAAQVRLEVPLAGEDVVEIEFTPGPELLPPAAETQSGDTDRGLKIVRQSLAGAALTVTVDGLGGGAYELRLANPGMVGSVEGAAFDGRVLRLELPAGLPGEFVRREITLRLK